VRDASRRHFLGFEFLLLQTESTPANAARNGLWAARINLDLLDICGGNMPERAIRKATISDQEQIVDLLVLAFNADPIERWLYPDPHEYLIKFPIFLRAFTAKSFESGNTYFVDGSIGAALWLPPNTHLHEESIITSLEQTIAEAKQADTFGTLEQMSRYHPLEPHWYLAIMGVDPTQQGKGIGSKLLKHTLAVCDRDHTLAYLESTNPKNISLYERHGFELLGTIRVGAAPPMFPMLRQWR
jgi:ribosomal protein S18 acetylase RimI-like enzyme